MENNRSIRRNAPLTFPTGALRDEERGRLFDARIGQYAAAVLIGD